MKVILALVIGFGWIMAPTDPLVEVGTFATGSPPPLSEQIRIVSYNLHGPFAKRIDDIKQVLTTHPALTHAAVFALQEVNRQRKETAYRDMARELAEMLDVHYAFAVENSYPDKDGGGVRGLALLSRYPMSDVERTLLPVPGPGGRRRILLGATVHLGTERLRVYTTHLETRISVEQRAQQIKAIIDQLERYRGMPTLVLGDFNTITEGARKKMFELMQAAGFSCPMPGNKATFQRLQILRLKLDWIWVRHVNATKAAVETEVTASDHRPIWVDVKLTDKPTADTATR
ncbi:MAG: endonuclease/exonuclease/phosphatase family protein [Acidobacteriota bacterium]|nr:endonuclease/exonuclease/phosphatase family protein [Blastocatellia bacterium]MDW8238050.1 endonuclease/exonuclease/phosphatase family protein [Acidobacteriota bacterium]